MQNFKIDATIQIPFDKNMDELFDRIILLIEEYDGNFIGFIKPEEDENEPETII